MLKSSSLWWNFMDLLVRYAPINNGKQAKVFHKSPASAASALIKLLGNQFAIEIFHAKKNIAHRVRMKKNQFSWMKFLGLDRSTVWDRNAKKLLRSWEALFIARDCVIKKKWNPVEENENHPKKSIFDKKKSLRLAGGKNWILLKNL